MGKKGKWFGAVKKVFSPESKEKKEERLKKKIGSGVPNAPDLTPSACLEETTPTITTTVTENSAAPPPALPVGHEEEEVKIAAELANDEVSIVEQSAVNGVAAAGIPTEEIAAIKIQTAFRGYLARRALRALRGLVRLKYLIQGNSVKRQAASTLRCMQTLARVQSQIRSRRLKMSEENQALQRQLLLNRELESLRMGEEWDDSLQSKEQIEASLVSRQEAAIRRERALAYAFSHQWKNSSKSSNPMFVDPNNPQWGWSWLERWMAARPWEGKTTTEKASDKDAANGDRMSVSLGEGEVMKSYNRRDYKPDKPSPTTPKARPASRQSPSTPSSKATTPSLAKKKPAAAPRSNGFSQTDDDVRSVVSSAQAERPRRHSIAGSTVRDDESLASSPSVPSYMAPTESARAKSRFSPAMSDDGELLEKVATPASVGSIKKRLSFASGVSTPAAMRRHSGPPKVEGALKDVDVHAAIAVQSNGQ